MKEVLIAPARMSRAVIWGFPLVFLIHDAEEILTTERFLQRSQANMPLPAVLRKHISVTTAQFAAAVAYIFALVCSASYIAARSMRPGWSMNIFATAVSVLFLNVFTHLGQTLLLRRYTPGVFTATTVALPYSLYALRRLRRARLVQNGTFLRTLLAAALLSAPLVMSALLVGKLLVRPGRPGRPGHNSTANTRL